MKSNVPAIALILCACTTDEADTEDPGAPPVSSTTVDTGPAETGTTDDSDPTGDTGPADDTSTTEPGPPSKRVPAEWEPQEAIWLQWPQIWESTYEPAFAKIVATIVDYEDVHLLVANSNTRNSAEAVLATEGGLSKDVISGGASDAGYRITWHTIPNDSAWMRDNGPRYVIDDGAMRIQNWEFDGWGGAFGNFPYQGDNAVPDTVGAYLGLPVDPVDIVHERGDLEFNGTDTVILNWTVIGDPNRNPGITQDEVIEAMQTHFGVSRVILLDGAPSGDLTGGHVDGIARFIDTDTVVVADCSADSHCQPGDADDQLYDDSASRIEAAGLEVIRWPFEAAVTYRGVTFDTDYLNWLVGNGFVISVGFDHATADANAKAKLEAWFPDRDVYVIEMLESWYWGGGVHCHTNDQPALPE